MTTISVSGTAGSRFLRGAGTAALLLAAILVTTWGLATERGVASRSGEVLVPDGVLRLDGVRGELLQHDLMPMPSGMMPDAVPEGYVRTWVDLTLAATDGSVTWAPEDFLLRGPGGLEAQVRRSSVEPVVIPRGSAATFALQFEVPAGVEGLELHVEGASRPLALRIDPEEQHLHDH